MKANYSPFWVFILIFKRRSQKFKLPPCLIYGSFLGRHPVTACFRETNVLLWVKCWVRGGVGDHQFHRILITSPSLPKTSVQSTDLLQVINNTLLICQAMIKLIFKLLLFYFFSSLLKASELQHECATHFYYYFNYVLNIFTCPGFA